MRSLIYSFIFITLSHISGQIISLMTSQDLAKWLAIAFPAFLIGILLEKLETEPNKLVVTVIIVSVISRIMLSVLLGMQVALMTLVEFFIYFIVYTIFLYIGRRIA